jgi:hypothetical protein
MNSMRHAYLAAVASLALAACPAFAETIDNPEFAMWQKHKKGTSITLKTTSSAEGVDSETTMTTTLLEVGADKVVVETSVVSKFNGMEFKTPPTKRDVEKTLELPEGFKKEDFQGPKPKGTYEEGTETVKVGAGEFKAKWYKYRIEIAGQKTEAKMWISDEVPGTMLKLETTTTGGGSSKTELLAFKKP